MVRYMVSLNWTSFIRSTLMNAFEAYGSALVGITPHEVETDRPQKVLGENLHTAHRG